MQARAPLMIEHRLIERMIGIITEAIPRIRSEQTAQPEFIDTVVDFFFTYIDRTHHGKEEEILFRTLDGKEISEHHRRLMENLIEEHALGRRLAERIAEANSRCRDGDREAFADIANGLAELADFYPKHIDKEDREFFPVIRAYLSEQEEKSMLDAYREFDSRVIHDVYRERVEDLEHASAEAGAVQAQPA